MAVTAYWYVNAFETAFDKQIDFLADDIAVILTTNSYTPDQDTHDFGNDITNEVAEANGYLQGLDGTGKLLGTKTHANTANVSTFDAANTEWTGTGAGITARRAVIVDVATATAATDPLICWTDFGQDETASGGGTFTIAWNASGIATITPADAP
jgi:hypothetical protein